LVTHQKNVCLYINKIQSDLNKHLLILVSCFNLYIAKAQYVTIPDFQFYWFLHSNYPAIMNGNQLDTTAPALATIKNISISGGTYPIRDLTGIQYFYADTSLEIISCVITNFSSLPSSLTRLTLSGDSLNYLPPLPQ